MPNSQGKTSEHYFSESPTSDTKFGLVKTCLRGIRFEFLTASSVFSVKRVDAGTRVLIENMILPPNGYVLDIGCGYGPVGIVAARINPCLHVVLTDVNRRAIQLARQNVERNSLTNIEVRQGSLYAPVADFCFDAVLSNPPISAGKETVENLVRNAPTIMKRGGSFQMVIQSKIGKKTFPLMFSQAFGNCSVLAIEGGYRILMAHKK